MLITITVVSILAVTVLVWLANRILPFKVCPVCAGVFLTWVWLLGAYFLGYQIALVVPALLMGGSVVGIVYQVEKKLRNVSAGAFLLWKAFFIPAGFVAAYAVLEQLWTGLFLAVAFLVAISAWFLSSNSRPDSRKETAEEIEKKMKDCC
ncbi:MAG: hypothetical protein Q7S50_00540 [bacterium]|nr:hypothetical protein [bacterium]